MQHQISEKDRLLPMWNVVKRTPFTPNTWTFKFTDAVDIDTAQRALEPGYEILHHLGHYEPNRMIYEPHDCERWAVMKEGEMLYPPTSIGHAKHMQAQLGGYIIHLDEGTPPSERLLKGLT